MENSLNLAPFRTDPRFLVRSITGHLLRVAQGRESTSDTLEILHSKVRTARVESARPEGLFLWQVYYPGEEDHLVAKSSDSV